MFSVKYGSRHLIPNRKDPITQTQTQKTHNFLSTGELLGQGFKYLPKDPRVSMVQS